MLVQNMFFMGLRCDANLQSFLQCTMAHTIVAHWCPRLRLLFGFVVNIMKKSACQTEAMAAPQAMLALPIVNKVAYCAARGKCQKE